MVFELGKARDGDGADEADSAHVERERSAVGGKLALIDERLLGEAAPALCGPLAHQQRAVTEAAHDAVLAFDPDVVVGRRAGERVVEEPLLAAADVDGDREALSASDLDQPQAERQRVLVREPVELQLELLELELGQREVRDRVHRPRAYRLRRAARSSDA